MFNFKVSGIAAGLAFIISMLAGVLGQTRMPLLLLRPFLFALLFFVVFCVIYMMISRFLPELLEGGGQSPKADLDMPGSKINISEGAGDFSPVMPPRLAPGETAALADDSDDSVGDISSLMKGARRPQPVTPGLDQNPADSYTTAGAMQAFPLFDGGVEAAAMSGGTGSEEEEPGVEEPAPAGDGSSLDMLPDLDSLAQAFSPSSGDDVQVQTVDYLPPEPAARKPSSSSKGQKMDLDFNPKELASGIRTILNKEG